MLACSLRGCWLAFSRSLVRGDLLLCRSCSLVGGVCLPARTHVRQKRGGSVCCLRGLAFSPLFNCQFGILIWFTNLILLSTLICRKQIIRARIVACFAACSVVWLVRALLCRVCLQRRDVVVATIAWRSRWPPWSPRHRRRSCWSARFRALFVFFERRRAPSFVFY